MLARAKFSIKPRITLAVHVNVSTILSKNENRFHKPLMSSAYFLELELYRKRLYSFYFCVAGRADGATKRGGNTTKKQ
jgi:hypothetical protein